MTSHRKRQDTRTRRAVLGSATALTAAATGAYMAGHLTTLMPAPAPARGPTAGYVPTFGDTQAGIARPAQPQTHALLTVLDVGARADFQAATMLADLGWAIAEVTDPTRAPDAVTLDGVGDLTVFVGIGPRLVAMASGPFGTLAPGSPPLPVSASLPAFAGDDRLPAAVRGGDLLLAVHASDATLVERVRDHLVAGVPGAQIRWSQLGFRNELAAGRTRDVLGFIDGITVPRTPADLVAAVWIMQGPARGGTVCVIRRIALDVDAFHVLGTAAQERVIGRRLADGTPLSGGGPLDPIDVNALAPNGAFAVPETAHARAAHFGGAPMLRRTYSYDGGGQRGVLFAGFQAEMETFVSTQRRLDQGDALMEYATTTASAAFLVLPGFNPELPLGGTLFRLPVAGLGAGRGTPA